MHGTLALGIVAVTIVERPSRLTSVDASHVAAEQSHVASEVRAQNPTRIVARMRLRGTVSVGTDGESTRVCVVKPSSKSKRSRSKRTTSGRA